MKEVGTVTYSEKRGAWIIECEPHVSMRLKRLFGKLSKYSSGKHVLSDTIETARDIEWFIERYPMKVLQPERLRARADAHRENQSLIDSIISGAYPREPFKLAVPLRDYQIQAAQLLLARKGLLLADDVGIGKTASAIGAFCDPRTLPVVVVTLTHLPKQWAAEIHRFAPPLRVAIIKKGTPYDLGKSRLSNPAQMRLMSSFPDVVIINYHKLAGWAETLAKVCKMVVWDEVQELRKKKSLKYEAAMHLAQAMKFRLGLSATPIYNYGGEIHTVMESVCPGELGNWGEFSTEWCAGYEDDKAKIQDPAALGSYMRSEGMMLRRTRADVRRELPDCQIIPHIVESDPDALDRVSSSCAELAKFILGGRPELERGERMRASEELSNVLRQATGIAKAPYVAEFVRLLIENGERVVLFGWHHSVYSIWLDRLKDLNPAFYTGEQSIPQKEEAKRRFVSKETPLLIISLRSGQGLDGLQYVCRTTVFGELDWSPGVHEQCVGRVYRDGQKDVVTAYYLISEVGSDPTVAEVLGIKRQQIEGIRRAPGEDALIETLQSDGDHVKRLAKAYLDKKPAEVDQEAYCACDGFRFQNTEHRRSTRPNHAIQDCRHLESARERANAVHVSPRFRLYHAPSCRVLADKFLSIESFGALIDPALTPLTFRPHEIEIQRFDEAKHEWVFVRMAGESLTSFVEMPTTVDKAGSGKPTVSEPRIGGIPAWNDNPHNYGEPMMLVHREPPPVLDMPVRAPQAPPAQRKSRKKEPPPEPPKERPPSYYCKSCEIISPAVEWIDDKCPRCGDPYDMPQDKIRS